MPHVQKRNKEFAGKALTDKQVTDIKAAIARGVNKQVILTEYNISTDTLRRVLNGLGRYGNQGTKPLAPALKVLAAHNHCRAPVAAAHAKHRASKEKLLKQIADLDSKYYAEISGLVQHACRVAQAPFIETYNAVTGALGSQDPRRGLDVMQVQAIRKALAAGVSGNKLAAQYGVSAMAISRLRRNVTYKD